MHTEFVSEKGEEVEPLVGPTHSFSIFLTKRSGWRGERTKRVKGKAIPLQALTGPEGSRRLMLPDFKTIDT
jgi:hypothetical protein